MNLGSGCEGSALRVGGCTQKLSRDRFLIESFRLPHPASALWISGSRHSSPLLARSVAVAYGSRFRSSVVEDVGCRVGGGRVSYVMSSDESSKRGSSAKR